MIVHCSCDVYPLWWRSQQLSWLSHPDCWPSRPLWLQASEKTAVPHAYTESESRSKIPEPCTTVRIGTYICSKKETSIKRCPRRIHPHRRSRKWPNMSAIVYHPLYLDFLWLWFNRQVAFLDPSFSSILLRQSVTKFFSFKKPRRVLLSF